MSGFGKASLESQYEGFKYFKLRTPDPKKGETETELVVRLLPSMKSYRDSGQWRFFYGQHYGYQGNNPRNPEKPRARPFGCIQKKDKAKNIIVACPKCTQIDKMRAKADAREEELAKANGIEDKKSPEFRDIKRNDVKLKTLNDWLSKHNNDKKFWINAMNKAGEMGVLQLSYTATQSLLILLNKLDKEEKTDAFDPSAGLWLRFTRTGSNPRVTDDVKVLEEVVDVGGRKLKASVPAPMTQEQIEKALKVCPDLSKEVVKFIDAATMTRLVESSGDPDDVDAIWPPEVSKVPVAAKQEAAGDSDGEPDEEPATDPVTETKVEVKAEPVVEAKTEVAAVVEEDDEEAALLAQMKALKARKAAALTAPATKVVDNADDFLSQFSAK